jgi:hypothetical protein
MGRPTGFGRRPRAAARVTDILEKRKNPGDDLFSRGAAPSVSSALESLTSVFGMGTGVASPLESPGFRVWTRVRQRPASHEGPSGAKTEIFDCPDCLGWSRARDGWSLVSC